MQATETRVPFLDLACIHKQMAAELTDAFAGILAGGAYILGEPLERFENEFAIYQNTRYCVGVGNGLEALSLSLRALGVGPQDDVLVPANTFIATWLAVSQVGARPVPVEPDPDTHLVDAAALRKAQTAATKAVIVVHLYGQPAKMDDIVDFCKSEGLFLVEDAAQAHGAEFKGRRVGSFGEAGAFSFYPGKNLGALGDAGAVTTNSESLADALRLLRNYGSAVKYIHEKQGFNSRLDALQAAILSVKLKYLDAGNERRREIAQKYFSGLKAACGLKLPAVVEGAKHVFHLFVVRHRRRDELQKQLSEAGIQTIIHYPLPPHLQNAYRGNSYDCGPLPVAEQLAGEVLSLPMGPHLTDEQVDYTIAQVMRICNELGA
jgi:dTDP-4-amino-4,6-dideoxygalactose transaminase